MKRLFKFLPVFILCLGNAVFPLAASDKKASKDDGAIGKIVLDLSKYADVTVLKTSRFGWVYALDDSGSPMEADGFEQDFKFKNSPITMYIHYGFFPNDEAARKGLSFKVKNAAEPSKTTPPPGMPKINKTKEVFFGASSASVSFRVGSVCVAITGFGGSPKERKAKVALFANRVIEHLKGLEK